MTTARCASLTALLCATVAGVAGCGSAVAPLRGEVPARTPVPAPAAPTGGPVNPARPPSPARPSSPARPPRPPAGLGTLPVVRARLTAGETSPAAARGSAPIFAVPPAGVRLTAAQALGHPCRLLTGGELGAIAGRAVIAEVEAPLGPTCIFRLAGGRALTVALEAVPVSGAGAGAGRSGCGRPGGQPLLRALSPGVVMRISGPCAIAERVAVRALSRLAA